MIIFDMFSHITLRGRITWLLLFFLCWYCSPSVLYIAFFFAVVAFFSEHSVIKDFSWTMTIFFFLSWFSILVSLIPITVYVTVELYHDHQRRLIQKANNANCAVHSHYGSGIPAVPTIKKVARPSTDVSSASTNNISVFTSGLAMLTDRSVSVCDASYFRHCQEVSDDYKQRWISSYGLGKPYLSIDIFRALVAYINYMDALKYCQRSLGIDSLVSRMTKLSLTESSLEQAPLVRAPPIDDCLYGGSGDISSLSACRCSGTGRTTLGSCSCLGHICSGSKCACKLSSENSNSLYVGADLNGSNRSSTLSGLTRAYRVSAYSFIMVMNHLEDQLSRLSLTANDKNTSVTTSSVGSNGSSSHGSMDDSNGISWNVSGLSSPLSIDLDVGYTLSAMMERCLSIADNVVTSGGSGGGVDVNHGNNDFVGKADTGRSIIDSNGACDYNEHGNNDGRAAGYYGSGANGTLSGNNVDDTGVDCGSVFASDEESLSIGVVQTVYRNQVLLGDVDTKRTCSSSSSDSQSNQNETQSIAVNNDSNNSKISNEDSSFYGDDKYGKKSDSSSYEETSDNGSTTSRHSDSGISDVSSSYSFVDYSAQYDYEQSYNPFQSDDDNSSIGTVPLYSGTAVFNDDTAFGTF